MTNLRTSSVFSRLKKRRILVARCCWERARARVSSLRLPLGADLALLRARSKTHLGSEALGEDLVGKTGDVGLSLLDDNKGKSADVGSDNASTDGLALALSILAGAVARVALGEEELDTVGNEDSLLEGESLLLLTANREICRREAGSGLESGRRASAGANWTRLDVRM
jgi:hypothetical protein